MTAEVKYVSGPSLDRDYTRFSNPPLDTVSFYVQVGKSNQLRKVEMTRQELIGFVQKALAILPHMIGAELEHASKTGEYKL